MHFMPMAEPILNTPNFLSDRDLLMVIHNNMDHLTADVKEMKEGIATDMKEMKDEMSSRVSSLEENKYNKSEAKTRKEDTDKIHADHELRIRRVEDWGRMAIGVLIVLQVLIPVIIKFF